eukprot:753826-Hanusia_phi.AAC.4
MLYQIHSQDGQSFGQGNLGMKGIESFLSTHTCNSICRSLRLPQYQYGRCIEDIEEQEIQQKQALVDDDRRSKSPLRWNSGMLCSTTERCPDAQVAGNAYGRGLERAVSSIATDDSPPKDRRVVSHQHCLGLTRVNRFERDPPRATTTSMASSTRAASRQRSDSHDATAT